LLPGRTTVIVTRNTDYKVEGALIAHSLQDAIALCKDDDEAFLIGGAELYQDGLKLSNKLYITEIALDVAGDAYFPDYSSDEWLESSREAHVSEQGLAFNYVTYIHK
jgi:dihydrofolate reductase